MQIEHLHYVVVDDKDDVQFGKWNRVPVESDNTS